MSLYRTFFYVISENQQFKDQRNFKNIVKKNLISFQVYYSTVYTVISCSLWSLFEQLSVVEYDPGTHDLQTTSLHFFEEPSMKVLQSCQKNDLSSCTDTYIVSEGNERRRKLYFFVMMCRHLQEKMYCDVFHRVDFLPTTVSQKLEWTQMDAVQPCLSMAPTW